jgi:hypothetical protein
MKSLAPCLVVLLAALVAAPLALAEQPPSSETSASVPELTDYHEVIYPLWHEAWPKKDFAMLSSLLPGIEAGAAKIEKAVLPGILRDKKAAWDAQVKKLGGIVSEYKAAVGAKDLQKTLDAGESLHRQYEVLIRTIRPALKEIDAFHQVLYRLYHYELPAFSLPAVQASAKELQEKMTALDAAVLPERMQSKKDAFEASRKELGAAVSELAALAAAGKDEKAIRAAIETTHTRYVALDQVF